MSEASFTRKDALMNDIRRTILWVIFGFSMVLLWDQWQLFNGQKPTFFPSATPATKPVDAAVMSGDRPSQVVPSAGLPSSPGVTPSPAAPVGATALAVPTGAQPMATKIERARVVATTDVFTLIFDTEGGSLVKSTFNKFKDTANKANGFVLLDESAGRVYVAQTGLISAGGAPLPTHKTPMVLAPGALELKDGQNEVSVRFESADASGVRLVKTYILRRGAYDILVRHEVINTGSASVTPQLYLQLVRDGNPPVGESAFYSTFTGPAVYTDAKKYQKIEFKDN